MRIAGTIAAALIFFSAVNAYASIPELQNNNKRAQYVTGYMLKVV